MGLQQNENYKGLSANYYKILSSTENYITGESHIMLGLYGDKTARDADIANNVLRKEKHTVPHIDLTRNDQYTKLKEDIAYEDYDKGELVTKYKDSKFKNATDILEV